jgi:hypothetical protein
LNSLSTQSPLASEGREASELQLAQRTLGRGGAAGTHADAQCVRLHAMSASSVDHPGIARHASSPVVGHAAAWPAQADAQADASWQATDSVQSSPCAQQRARWQSPHAVLPAR